MLRHTKKNNGVTSKVVVYEWDHENSVPKRILPTSPPPPRWCWGSLDVVLKESESIDFNTEKEGSSVGTANESVEDSDSYAVVESESSETSRVIEYNHGRKFVINPFFKKVSSEQKQKFEGLPQDQILQVETPVTPVQVESFPEQALLLAENLTATSPKKEEFLASEAASSCSSEYKTPLQGIQLGDYVKGEKERFPKKNVIKSSTQTRRRVPLKKSSSDLDFLVGQKLSKVRMGISARNYAKPPTVPKLAADEGPDPGDLIKSMENELAKMEEGSDDDQSSPLNKPD